MIEFNGKTVGHFGFRFDEAPKLIKHIKSSWAAIIIGEGTARGKGLGRASMAALEKEAYEKGARCIELGVFEFNAAALSLYEKMGYQGLASVPNFTLWEGKRGTDIRLVKYLGF
jgi:GNAT superfamily N-acetyltransferase